MADKALRRPLESEEKNELLEVYRLARAHNLEMKEGIKGAIQAILMSPHFLYHIYEDANYAAGQLRALTNRELAMRLASFLWGTLPDTALLNAQLSNQNVLKRRIISK